MQILLILKKTRRKKRKNGAPKKIKTVIKN